MIKVTKISVFCIFAVFSGVAEAADTDVWQYQCSMDAQHTEQYLIDGAYPSAGETVDLWVNPDGTRDNVPLVMANSQSATQSELESIAKTGVFYNIFAANTSVTTSLELYAHNSDGSQAWIALENVRPSLANSDGWGTVNFVNTGKEGQYTWHQSTWLNQMTLSTKVAAAASSYVVWNITAASSVLPLTLQANDEYREHTFQVSLGDKSMYAGSTTPVLGWTGDKRVTFGAAPLITCTRAATPFQFSITSEVDFGNNIRTGLNEIITRNVQFTMTSGTQTPSATLLLTSDKTTADGNLNLGGGTVTWVRNSDNRNVKMNEGFAIDARAMDFTLSLNTQGAVPGNASTIVNAELTLN